MARGRVIFRQPGRPAGYIIVAEDGGVFAKGSNVFYGSAVGSMAGTCVAAQPTLTGNGYYLLGSGGAVYTYGDASYQGGGGGDAVDLEVDADGVGYWILHGDGAVWSQASTYYGNQ